ncbi:Anaphase-promoting complex subunit 7 [Dissostichus eleginoides]|uniref:Anaphase-promoting complex subunit 7 n=1 Tax=Dissostichus eleginoides TaxID=100907 RepID=A0AAD9BYM9_DISEL|nr:Anaphase-promoting complex subunit 7 [Dissostichus eleginoides]
MKTVIIHQPLSFILSFVELHIHLDPNDQKSLEGMQKMEKEESPTDATVELDGDDMEGSGEDGDLEGSDSEAAQWADQEQWFGMQ